MKHAWTRASMPSRSAGGQWNISSSPRSYPLAVHSEWCSSVETTKQNIRCFTIHYKWLVMCTIAWTCDMPKQKWTVLDLRRFTDPSNIFKPFLQENSCVYIYWVYQTTTKPGMPTCQNHSVALTNKEYQQHGRSQACTITGDIHHQQQLKQMPNQSLGHWVLQYCNRQNINVMDL